MRRTPVWMACLGWLLLAGSAHGQLSDVLVEVPQTQFGLDGYLQPGQWTPMQLQLTNQSAELRSVVARWIVADDDGDEVFAERAAPLNPGVTQNVWLYAPLPVTMRESTQWVVQVIDADSRRELARHRVSAPNIVPVTTAMIGVCGSVDMGLRDYEPAYTQHEPIKFIRGMSLSTLPDRWYGLDALHALIWTGEGSEVRNDPTDASVTPQVVDALRQWVKRGGHLVLVLPLDQTWSDSDLADLMPVSKDRIVRVDDFDWTMLAGYLPAGITPKPISALTFDVEYDDPDVAVLARGREKRAYVVAKRYGFGRVTAIGVDLTRGDVRALGIPSGQQRVWNRVFNWAAPVITEQVYQGDVSENKMLSISAKQGRGARLDDMLSGFIAMTGTAAPALLSAILIFALYWVLAGPVAFVVLRRRGMAQHAWLGFVALAGVFTAITWGGAWMIRPSHTKLEHVSFLDIDANNATVHTRSWVTLLVPKFGDATVALDPEEQFPGQTLGSPGAETRTTGGEFLDPQQYTVDSADPRSVTIPVRSTAKRFTLDYMGKLDRTFAGVTDDWGLPGGEVRMDETGSWPTAKLKHNLPGELRDVMVIYCRGSHPTSGDALAPWVSFVDKWPAGQPLELRSPWQLAKELYWRPTNYEGDRLWENEGYLGQIVARHKGRTIDPKKAGYVHSVTDVTKQQLIMLSLYDMLPAPDFRNTSLAASLQSTHYERTLLRDIDISPLLSGRRLILIGFLADSPLPAPLTLDGEDVPSRGMTVVRWVYDL